MISKLETRERLLRETAAVTESMIENNRIGIPYSRTEKDVKPEEIKRGVEKYSKE